MALLFKILPERILSYVEINAMEVKKAKQRFTVFITSNKTGLQKLTLFDVYWKISEAQDFQMVRKISAAY